MTQLIEDIQQHNSYRKMHSKIRYNFVLHRTGSFSLIIFIPPGNKILKFIQSIICNTLSNFPKKPQIVMNIVNHNQNRGQQFLHGQQVVDISSSIFFAGQTFTAIYDRGGSEH
ncbi:unnamed protein product [Acanthoscelides obtectus]|uniref:Uncharacterized protein n=1 Tax=Acanthoscelides obtectus TaxID=200917 RepID=A0A9P0KM87_ACAOB|nr:unnamed protein product [Acanthoscelides obtectus]CAK1664957.1 hypothetical protein AOBTE_LOCUS24578 [Acanthoscelides obtectus]